MTIFLRVLCIFGWFAKMTFKSPVDCRKYYNYNHYFNTTFSLPQKGIIYCLINGIQGLGWEGVKSERGALLLHLQIHGCIPGPGKLFRLASHLFKQQIICHNSTWILQVASICLLQEMKCNRSIFQMTTPSIFLYFLGKSYSTVLVVNTHGTALQSFMKTNTPEGWWLNTVVGALAAQGPSGTWEWADCTLQGPGGWCHNSRSQRFRSISALPAERLFSAVLMWLLSRATRKLRSQNQTPVPGEMAQKNVLTSRARSSWTRVSSDRESNRWWFRC